MPSYLDYLEIDCLFQEQKYSHLSAWFCLSGRESLSCWYRSLSFIQEGNLARQREPERNRKFLERNKGYRRNYIVSLKLDAIHVSRLHIAYTIQPIKAADLLSQTSRFLISLMSSRAHLISSTGKHFPHLLMHLCYNVLKVNCF